MHESFHDRENLRDRVYVLIEVFNSTVSGKQIFGGFVYWR